jgi:hypothetical protein
VEEVDLEASSGVIEAQPDLTGQRLEMSPADRAELGDGRGGNGTSPGSESREKKRGDPP